jgi:putative oxidoreductase
MEIRPVTNATRNIDARLDPHAPTALSVFRIIIGLLFLCHGLSHVFGWPSGPAAPVGLWPYFYAGCIELAVSVLVTVGLFTRIAAFFGAGTMAFAYFTQHLPKDFFPINNGGELAVLYCFAFLLLIFTGGGAFALDGRRR